MTNVEKNSKVMYVGSSFALKVNKAVKSYGSSNKSVAEVDGNGVIYAKKKGSANITVTGTDGTKQKIKITVKPAKYYIISKKAGTYSSAIKVKIKAKLGYKLYYTTSGKFKTGKLIKSGKSKVLSIKKTTTVLLYAVKASEKVTAKQMNTAAKRDLYVYYVQYQYTIGDSQPGDSEASEDTENGNSESGGNTGNSVVSESQ